MNHVASSRGEGGREGRLSSSLSRITLHQAGGKEGGGGGGGREGRLSSSSC